MKKYLSLALCVFVLTATANTAQAFDKKDLAKLKKTNQCIRCKLIEADLRRPTWSWPTDGANLTDGQPESRPTEWGQTDEARLSRANLSGANLIATGRADLRRPT